MSIRCHPYSQRNCEMASKSTRNSQFMQDISITFFGLTLPGQKQYQMRENPVERIITIYYRNSTCWPHYPQLNWLWWMNLEYYQTTYRWFYWSLSYLGSSPNVVGAFHSGKMYMPCRWPVVLPVCSDWVSSQAICHRQGLMCCIQINQIQAHLSHIIWITKHDVCVTSIEPKWMSN